MTEGLRRAVHQVLELAVREAGALVDDQLRHESDKPTIGLILCQQPNQVLAEYALRGMDKPIGIAGFELTRQLPTELQSSLPSIESIEQALAGDSGDVGESVDDPP